MVREIVHIQIGQSGNCVGSKFYNRLCEEHSISTFGPSDNCENDKVFTFFDETRKNFYRPRAILLCSDPDDNSKIITGDNPEIYFYEYKHRKVNSVWPYYYSFDEIENDEKIIEAVRKETEKCNSFQGFQFVHSLGGGRGSGLCCYLLQKLQDEYPDRKKITYSIFPSENASNFFYCEPYNFVLSVPFLTNYADQVICIDNEGILNVCNEYFRSIGFSFNDMNFLISLMMSNFTCSMRFDDQLNADLNKIVANLNPYNKLHFLISSLAPLKSIHSQVPYANYNINDIICILNNDEKNLFAACDIKNASYLAAFAQFRGFFKPIDIYNGVKNAPLIPNLKFSFCDNSRSSASLFQNTTAIKDVFNRLYSQFKANYESKKYFYKFVFEGAEQDEFENASLCLKCLIDEYESVQQNL